MTRKPQNNAPVAMRVMITTPARNAMEGHGLTDAVLIVDDQRVAVAYSVFSPATSRYSLVTLDGRWIIPGKDGYKTRGPASTYARKNIADVRPDGLVILEPVRHNGRYAVTRYGQRRAGICQGAVSYGQYGYSCHCGASLTWDEVNRDGFVTVTDGRRGTHVQAYAVRREHGVEWSQDLAMQHDAPVVAATPFRPAAEVIAQGQERKAAEDARKAVSAPVAEVPAETAPQADAPALVGPYGVRAYEVIVSNASALIGGPRKVTRWAVVDANGVTVSDDHLSKLAADTRADFLNGERGQGQTPDTCPESTPDNARRLVASGATGRAYVTGNGARMRIESADGRCAFTLHTVPDEAHDEAKAGFAATAREFADVIRNRAESETQFKPAKVQMWSGKPAPRKAFEPKDYAPGSMLAWTVDGVRYTGQVWATRVQGGDWNRNHSSYKPGEATAVIVATVDGRRACRDEAVAVPLYTGSRRKTAYAHVAFPMGPMDSDGCVPRWQADVTVIAPECASDGLFDVVTPRVDDMDVWEGEGGAFVGEYDDVPEAPAVDAPAPVADAPAESAPEAERIVGAYCHRCQEDGLVIAGTCRRCGRVDIVAAMTASGPRMCPAEEKARATGRLYCGRCFRTGAALYASMYWTADGEGHRFHICADCYGHRVPSAQPADVKAPAGATVRAARKAREFAERHGCSAGDQFRAAEAARLRVAQEFGARAGDVISDPCGEAAWDAWEGEGGTVPGVATPAPAPEGEPSDGDVTADAAESEAYAAETASEPAASTRRDASTSSEDRTPVGEGGFSRELDAYASERGSEVRGHVADVEVAAGTDTDAAECGDEQMKEAADVAEAETCEACGRERHPDTALYVGACRPQSWTYCSRANTGQGAIIPTGVQEEEAAAADPGAIEAAADGEGQEVSEESADIVIRHTPADGISVGVRRASCTVAVRGSTRPSETASVGVSCKSVPSFMSHEHTSPLGLPVVPRTAALRRRVLDGVGWRPAGCRRGGRVPAPSAVRSGQCGVHVGGIRGCHRSVSALVPRERTALDDRRPAPGYVHGLAPVRAQAPVGGTGVHRARREAGAGTAPGERGPGRGP
ncbi:hypothetical protein ACH4UM_41625 [Streptomyces sp. NPDC020801]|uniref:hypothetical protein n=1 Tax=Streptomyces sp. NPDC020801 TaxID=3365093 RepID=UPI0037AB61D0